jgi:PAS domain S-box-containing protein
MPEKSADDRQANPLEPDPLGEIAEALRRASKAILRRWDELSDQAAGKLPPLSYQQMRDHMPQILGQLADLLESPTRLNMQALVDIAPAHGVVRFQQEYDVPHLMAEGRLLRRAMVEKVEETLNRQMHRDESIGLHTGIDIFLHGGILAMVQRQMEAFRRSEQNYRTAVEQVRDYAIFMVDPQERMATWNAGVRHMLGWEEAEFIGQPFSVIFPPEDVPDAPRTELRQARLSGRTDDDRWQIRHDGRRFWSSGITTAITDRHGRLSGYLKVMRDLTERKLAEEQLAHAKQEAESANRAKDEFLAILSHELRTPLTPVLLAVSLLENRGDLSPEMQQDLETIRRSVEAEAQLIDDLLDLTRITRGKLQLNPERVDVHLVVRHALDLCCRDVPHQISVELSAAQHVVWADPARLQQVLGNLLSNAVKFTPGTGRISVRSENTADQVRIAVSDTGIGIKPQLLPRIFNAFEQGGEGVTRRFGGLGLGLAISKRLVEMQSGNLQASSQGPGRGATFSIELPVASAAQLS